MKKIHVLVLFFLSFSGLYAQDPNFHIYLCFGQSNMEGPAAISPQDKEVNGRLKLLSAVDCPELGRETGKWYDAVPPLCRCNTRLSPADYFGRTMTEKLPDGITIGLVHVAVAGSKIEIFDKQKYKSYLDSSATEKPWMIRMANDYGGNPYQRLVDMARIAQKDGVIKGILLHQGESNTGDELWPHKVKKIYDDLLADLNMTPNSVPLLAGELVGEDQGGKCASMNQIIAKLPQTMVRASVVSSAGLEAVPDKLHFSAEGIREFGKRYAEKMLEVLPQSSKIVVPAKQWEYVLTTNGKLRGTYEDKLQVFRGIPFAAPPVGQNRWRAPQPASDWEGIRAADQFAPAPMQGGNPPSGKSEDCLYLNVWSPAESPKEKLPVLVWIYGGGFAFGSTSEPGYSGENLAKKGVVLVSVAYRVGQLGFLAHPELSAETSQKTSGNYGLQDMIAGLQWVKNNIEAFGGDPNKVTIFGESAGGIAVSMLSASPLAKGLFHGAISQSGGSFGPPRVTTYPGENMKLLSDAEALGTAYMQKAGVSSLQKMRVLEVSKLPMGFGMPGGWPIIDGYVVPADQYSLYEKGNYNDTPILVGYNSDEGLSFSPPKTPQDYLDGVKKRYGKFAEPLIKAYPVDADQVPKSARDLARDAAFGWHTWSWARLQSETGKSAVYYYYFDQHPIYPKDSPLYGTGSPHGQDVAFVFGHLNPSSKQATETDEAVSDAIITYWTNFAKFGNPNGPGVPEWQKFTRKNHAVMHFRQKPVMGEVPDENSLQVLNEYFKWRRSDEGKSWANE